MENTLEKFLLQIISGQRKGLLAELTRLLLFFLEQLYVFLLKIRYYLYNFNIIKSKRLNCPVVSIGNITVGGTGKTPMVSFLAQQYSKKGLSVVVVSRGYKAANSQARVITDGKKLLLSVEEAGDEALMLSKKLPGIPIVAGKDRYSAGQLALERFSPDLILLDDGFQHWSLCRDRDIVLLDGINSFGYKHLLPGGLLREPLRALSRADILVITKVNSIDQNKVDMISNTLKKYNPTAEIYTAKYQNDYIYLYYNNGDLEKLPAEFLAGKRVLAFSGIGNPASFQKNLEECGAAVNRHLKFSDHYQYTIEDVTEIMQYFTAAQFDFIVTTEKDVVKLDEKMMNMLTKKCSLAVLGIRMKIDEEEHFIECSLNDIEKV